MVRINKGWQHIILLTFTHEVLFLVAMEVVAAVARAGTINQ